MGRRAHSEDEAGIAIKLPRSLLNRLKRYADSQFCSRAVAVQDLLAAGLDNVERKADLRDRNRG